MSHCDEIPALLVLQGGTGERLFYSNFALSINNLFLYITVYDAHFVC